MLNVLFWHCRFKYYTKVYKVKVKFLSKLAELTNIKADSIHPSLFGRRIPSANTPRKPRKNILLLEITLYGCRLGT